MSLRSPSVALSALRAALPLLAGQVVTLAAGVALSAALVLLLAPEEMAQFGRMGTGLKWVVVLGMLGLPTGLLRHAAERRDRARPLFLGALGATLGMGVLVAGALTFVPALSDLLLSDDQAETAFRVFVWKTPLIGVFALSAALLHAGGRLRRKGGIEALERVLLLVASVGGAALAGFEGLVAGSVIGSALAAAAALFFAAPLLSPAGSAAVARSRAPGLGDIFRVGRARAGILLLETLRPVVLLQVLTVRGGGDQGVALLYGGMLFTLPLIALPESLAQALYPSMLDSGGKARDLDTRSRRMLLELLLAALPLLLLVGGVLSLLLPLVRDGAYAGSVPAMWALLPGVLAHGLTAHTGYVILVKHRLPLEGVVSAVALGATATLSWFLVPVLGATGAGLALSGALLLRAALLLLVARR